VAIGTMHIEWLSTLALRSQIPAGAAVLDLGPQDLWIERDPLQRIARRHLEAADCDKTLDAIFDGKSPRPGAQPAFYSIFGGGNYRSIDLTDPRADYALDLNLPLPPGVGSYDVVTNFGTTEHVFNIGQAFANIHKLLKVGGIQLHAIPSYGYIDHGFYNIHPCAYLDMARANDYEIVDVLYIDNINVRMARPIEAKPFDFSTLPIQLGDMTDTVPLMTKAAMLFHHNLQSAETQKVLAAMVPKEALKSRIAMPDKRLPIFIVFDLMFVALRRTSRSPDELVAPIQGVYADMQKKNAAAAPAAETTKAPDVTAAAAPPTLGQRVRRRLFG
jgi:SAM-dependent methyltransferase